MKGAAYDTICTLKLRTGRALVAGHVDDHTWYGTMG